MTDTSVKQEKENQQRVDIPVTLDRAQLVKQFTNERTRPAMEKHMDALMPAAQSAVHAKGLFRTACVGARSEEWVEIDGVRFTSRVLSKSLAGINTVVPYIFTCGRELDELPVSPKDYLRYYCLDIIKMHVVFQAARYFMDYLKEYYHYPEITHLHPGEFADFPIEQEVPLFTLFEDTEKAIGVKLTSTRTIQPVKSGSGMLFYNGPGFESCQLCLQARCPNRRAAYNPALAEKFGIMHRGKEK
jgi:hypothetical protein